MYIRRTTHRKALTGKTYTTHKLIHGYRNSQGKVRQETMLNLGADFSIPDNMWKPLTDRIEELLSGKQQQQMFAVELPKEVERRANALVKKIIKKRSEQAAMGVSRVETSKTVKTEPNYQTVDIDSTEHDDVRFIGGEYLGVHACNQLELPKILEDIGFTDKEANAALANIIARLVMPSSELRAHRYLTGESALDELLDTDFTSLPLLELYFASDRLLAHKDQIEELLYKRERELFQFNEAITLYDITNTYFEGHPEHSGAKRGRSKEKRSDCQLVSLGILLDGSGFPKKSKILPGNISEAGTLKQMLEGLSKSTTVIMDAGIGTKENRDYLKAEGYTYITVKRDSDLTMPAESPIIMVKDTPQNKVEVALVENGDEVELYCHSSAKEAQSKDFVNKVSLRLEEELTKLNMGLKYCDLQFDLKYITDSTAIILGNGDVYTNGTNQINMLIKADLDKVELAGFSKHEELSKLVGNNDEIKKLLPTWNGQLKIKAKLLRKLKSLLVDYVEKTKPSSARAYTKIVERVGRLKERYKSVAYMYDINVIADSDKNNATLITYVKNDDKVQNKQSGIYCLSSTRKDLSADMLWNTYTMLTDLESAFRCLKAELGMRPVYHQLEHRIDGHIFISILAYHMLHTIRYQLKQQGVHHSWERIRQIMSTQVRITTSQDLKDGGVVKIRKTSRSTPDQVEIYKALDLEATPCKMTKTYLESKEGKQLL